MNGSLLVLSLLLSSMILQTCWGKNLEQNPRSKCKELFIPM